MTQSDYLLQCTPEEVQATWFALGEITVNQHTKHYIKDTVIRITCNSGEFKDRFVYVTEPYLVDNKNYFDIDWSTMTVDDISKMYVANQGITLSYFIVLPGQWRAGNIPDKNFIPFQNVNITVNDGGIIISDDELEQILAPIGFPFVTFNDIELARNQILRVCVKAGMQRYYTYRPIIKEDSCGNMSIGKSFDVPFPPHAFRAIPYYTTPGGYSQSGSGSPFAFYNEQAIFGGGITGGLGGGRFGKPIRYNKPVPGYAGLEENSSLLDALAAKQGYLNFFRREKYSEYYNSEDNLRHIKGFSTIGGMLNVKWMCYDPDWRIIPLDDVIVFARPMCQSEVLLNFGMLRSLVKTDIAGQLDPTVLLNQRKEIEDELKPMLKSVGISGAYSAIRGGG